MNTREVIEQAEDGRFLYLHRVSKVEPIDFEAARAEARARHERLQHLEDEWHAGNYGEPVSFRAELLDLCRACDWQEFALFAVAVACFLAIIYAPDLWALL